MRRFLFWFFCGCACVVVIAGSPIVGLGWGAVLITDQNPIGLLVFFGWPGVVYLGCLLADVIGKQTDKAWEEWMALREFKKERRKVGKYITAELQTQMKIIKGMGLQPDEQKALLERAYMVAIEKIDRLMREG